MLRSFLGALGITPEGAGFNPVEEKYNQHIGELAASTPAAIAVALSRGVDFVACADPTLDGVMPYGRGLRVAGGATALTEEQLRALAEINPNLVILGHEACGYVFSNGAVTTELQAEVNQALRNVVQSLNADNGWFLGFGVQPGGSAPLRNE